VTTAGAVRRRHRCRSAVRWILVTTSLAAAPLHGQASPFIPLDDPRMPLVEHLIVRGDISDPTPLIRPFRRSDLVRAIDAARLDTATSAGRLALRLRRDFSDPPAESWGAIAPRGGVQAYSHARRDLLEPGGDGGVTGYAESEFSAVFGPLALVSRPAAENRLDRDPDWVADSTQRQKHTAYRFIDAYISAQFRLGTVQFGQIDRNWGPVGLPGLGLSNYGYPRTDLSFELGPPAFRIRTIGTQLDDERDADSNVVHRYFVTHRLDVRVRSNLTLAIWENSVTAGRDLQFEPSNLNPLLLYIFAAQFGRKDNSNSMVGGDAHWRIHRTLLLEGQAVIDDWRFGLNRSAGETPRPNRWGLSVTASGPLGTAMAWRGSYTMVSSLAFHTQNPTQNFTDGGVGIGRNFPDNGLLSLTVMVPVRERWLLTPEADIQVQGEGRLDQPFPEGAALTATPEWLIGTVATTWRLAIGVSGQPGPLGLSAVAGFHHITNAGNQAGVTLNRFEGRVTATIGFRTSHALPAN
jgi:hypothetical protein